MRKTHNQQLPLAEVTADHPKAKELLEISKILDSKSNIYNMVLQDLATSSKNIILNENLKFRNSNARSV